MSIKVGAIIQCGGENHPVTGIVLNITQEHYYVYWFPLKDVLVLKKKYIKTDLYRILKR